MSLLFEKLQIHATKMFAILPPSGSRQCYQIAYRVIPLVFSYEPINVKPKGGRELLDMVWGF